LALPTADLSITKIDTLDPVNACRSAAAGDL